MAEVLRSFSVLETAPKAWAAVFDVSGWTLALDQSHKKGWGNRWSAPEVRPGAPVEMLYNATLMQEWVVDEVMPGERLRLVSRAWHGKPQLSMSSSIEARVSRISDTETRVDLKVVSVFDGPFGGLLNALLPLKADLRRFLAQMERGLLKSLGA